MNISDLKDDTGNLENYVLLRMFGDIRRNLALNPFVMKSVAVNVNEHGFLCELYRLGMLGLPKGTKEMLTLVSRGCSFIWEDER